MKTVTSPAHRRAFAVLWLGQLIAVAGLTTVVPALPVLPFYLPGLEVPGETVTWWTSLALAVTAALFVTCRFLQGLLGGVVPANAVFASTMAKEEHQGRTFGGLRRATATGFPTGPVVLRAVPGEAVWLTPLCLLQRFCSAVMLPSNSTPSPGTSTSPRLALRPHSPRHSRREPERVPADVSTTAPPNPAGHDAVQTTKTSCASSRTTNHLTLADRAEKAIT